MVLAGHEYEAWNNKKTVEPLTSAGAHSSRQWEFAHPLLFSQYSSCEQTSCDQQQLRSYEVVALAMMVACHKASV
jgi:hypothetical protein